MGTADDVDVTTGSPAREAPALRVGRAGAVLRLTIDRPRTHHALDAVVLRELRQQFRLVADDPGVRVVVVASTGDRSFCAGADLGELDPARADGDGVRRFLGLGREVTELVAAARVPVVCRVQGAALGGGFELALACSVVVASEWASFGLPESRLGLIPGFGGTQRLTAAAGRAAALHLMLTGGRWDAATAWRHGLLAVPPAPADGLDAAVDEVVAGLLRSGPLAVARILGAVRHASRGAASAAGLDTEAEAAVAAATSAEGAEGVRAFLERRSPTFTEALP